MKRGDLAWQMLRQGSRLVMVLDVRTLHGLPEWVQVLADDGASWTVASQVDVIDTSDATAG